MRASLSLIRLSFKRARFIFTLPILLGYLIIPAISSAAYRSLGLSRCLETISYATHTLIPICAVLWGMAYLQMWIDNDGQETIRACSRGKQTCAFAMVFLMLYLTVILLPIYLVAHFLVDYSTSEYIKVFAEMIFSVSMLYFISLVSRTVSVGIITVIAYLLFCVFFSGNAVFAKYCLINPSLIAEFEDVISRYFPLILLSLLLVVISHFYERYLYRKY